MGWGGVCRDGEPAAEVIREHRGTSERRVGRSGSCVASAYRLHGEGDSGGGCLSARVGGGVGERVWSAVTGSGCVDVRAIRCNCNGSVAWSGVGRDRKRGATIIGQHGCSRKRSIGGCRAGIADGEWLDRYVHDGRRGLSACIRRCVGKGIWSRVPGGRRVCVCAVGSDRD